MESGGKMILTLKPTAPYDFDKLVERIRSHHELVTIENNELVRTLRVGLEGKPVLIRAAFVGSLDEPGLEVKVTGEITEEEKDKLFEQLEQMFTANMDMGSFYDSMNEDQVMSQVVQRLYGLRLFTDANLFECMVRTIIGQQLNISFAATLTKRLIALGAAPLEVDGVTYPVFPSPSEIASMSVESLRELQFSQRKAEYVIDFAKAVVSGTVDLDGLRAMEDEEVIEALVKLRGIGRWTVECLLLFGLGRLDLLPAADIGLRNAVRNEYGLDHQPTEQEVREIGAAWAPYRSYATYYLWETLNDSKPKAMVSPEQPPQQKGFRQMQKEKKESKAQKREVKETRKAQLAKNSSRKKPSKRGSS
jgi:DNA-3-methyladenine glycosylase II